MFVAEVDSLKNLPDHALQLDLRNPTIQYKKGGKSKGADALTSAYKMLHICNTSTKIKERNKKLA